MDFLLDAHIPPSLCTFIKSHGHSAVHTKDLPGRNETSDAELIRLPTEQNLAIITKGSDFYHSHLIRHEPKRLLLVRTGNMKVKELKDLFENYFEKIVSGFKEHDLIELHRDCLVM